MKKFVERILGRPEQGARTAEESAYTEPGLPAGRRLYCIGDIHGRLDLLEELHGMIRGDATAYAGSKAVIYLGDFIDRGAQSFDTICLLGNHEQSMLDFLEHPQSAAAWLNFGGQVTLLSYGVGLGRVQMMQHVELLSDERADVRVWSASVLGSLGADGQDAVPALMGMLVDNEKIVRDQAKRSLELLSN